LTIKSICDIINQYADPASPPTCAEAVPAAPALQPSLAVF
jgi:hypothetical protein